jgi:hypothetical protein
MANAYPTLAGPTGTGVLPNGNTLHVGQLDVAGDYVAARNFSDDGWTMNDKHAVPVRVLLGVAKGFEIGGGYDFHSATVAPNILDFGGPSGANAWNINAKYVLPFRPLGASWGLGALYSHADIKAVYDTVSDTQFYFAGTRTLFGSKSSGTRLDATVGVNYTRQASSNLGVERPVRLFGSAQYYLARGFSVAGDIQCKQESVDKDPLYSLVGRYQLNKGFGVQAGWSNADYLLLNGERGSRFFAGINLGLGK